MRNRILILSALAALILINPSEASARRQKGTAIVAHRGFWNCEEAGHAKNSLASLRCDQEAGFWGSEFDVNMTSDEVLLVFHDGKIDGKRIEKHPYEDFKYYRLANGEPIPTIDQYLEQAKKHPETMLVYELKTHSCKAVEDRFVELSIEKLKEYDLLDPSKVMFIPFSYNICKVLAEKLPGFTVQYLDGNKSPKELKADGISGMDYHFNIFKMNPKLVAKAKRKGMSVNAWTVNKEDDMRVMLKQKVNMLTTDHPLEARKLMGEMKVKEIR